MTLKREKNATADSELSEVHLGGAGFVEKLDTKSNATARQQPAPALVANGEQQDLAPPGFSADGISELVQKGRSHVLSYARKITSASDVREADKQFAAAEASIKKCRDEERFTLKQQNEFAEGRLILQRQGGKLLAAYDKNKGGRPRKGVSPDKPSGVLQDVLGTKTRDQATQISSRWQRVCAIPQDVFDACVDARAATSEDREISHAGLVRFAKLETATEEPPVESGEETILILSNGSPVQERTNESVNRRKLLNKNDEWYTPAKYIKAARIVMKRIDLDPTSCEEAQKLVNAEKIFTKEQDGLKQAWKGNLWCNFPYSYPLIARFTAKLLEEIAAEQVTQACVLVNNSTDSHWFQKLAGHCSAMCLVHRRISFINERGESGKSSPKQGQVIFYFGPNVGEFYRVFGEFGICVSPNSNGANCRDSVARFVHDLRGAGEIEDEDLVREAMISSFDNSPISMEDLKDALKLFCGHFSHGESDVGELQQQLAGHAAAYLVEGEAEVEFTCRELHAIVGKLVLEVIANVGPADLRIWRSRNLDDLKVDPALFRAASVVSAFYLNHHAGWRDDYEDAVAKIQGKLLSGKVN